MFSMSRNWKEKVNLLKGWLIVDDFGGYHFVVLMYRGHYRESRNMWFKF